MKWNYRVVRTKKQTPWGPEDTLSICEVHYDEHDQVDGWSDPIAPLAMSVDEMPAPLEDLRWVLDRMQEALEKPILDAEKLEQSIPVEERIPHREKTNP